MKENKYAISTHHLWIDLNNRRFGYLKVLGFLHVERKWECLCNCGKLTIVRGSHLLNGNVNSCGCLAKEKLIERNITHGKRYTKEYNIFHHMKGRCYNETNCDYKNYGGRGIKVCERWLGKDGFINFLNDMGDCTEGFSLDRKDVDGNYSKENCRWVDRKTQNRNKRNNIWVNFKGEKRLLVDLAEEFGFSYESLRRILSKKSDIEKEKYLIKKINKNY